MYVIRHTAGSVQRALGGILGNTSAECCLQLLSQPTVRFSRSGAFASRSSAAVQLDAQHVQQPVALSVLVLYSEAMSCHDDVTHQASRFLVLQMHRICHSRGLLCNTYLLFSRSGSVRCLSKAAITLSKSQPRVCGSQ